ncbi:MAG TPA: energy-coupling factor ABC transporter permease [Rhodocyclaceae bacterium]|nr:energy-coupling factor ABC transporter permease [Rhodocyclaceae bacterium]
MNLPDTLLDEAWYWAAWAVWAPLLALSIRRAPWGRLKESAQSNLWWGMIVLLALLWSLVAGVKPGLSLHLLGATVFTLCFGPWFAFIGLSLVLAAVTFNGSGGWLSFAFNSLVMAGVGSAASYGIFRLAERWLPKHFFIYVFVNGFFGAALAVVAVGVAACLLLALAGAYSLEYLVEEYLPYFLLLGFSEAWLSGMAMTLFVIYRPHWVATFDDARYLANK